MAAGKADSFCKSPARDCCFLIRMHWLAVTRINQAASASGSRRRFNSDSNCAATDWTMFGHDNARSFASPDTCITKLNAALLRPKWFFNTKSPVTAQPAWVGDFVNHLARTNSERNLNLGIRVQVEAASKVSSTLLGG